MVVKDSYSILIKGNGATLGSLRCYEQLLNDALSEYGISVRLSCVSVHTFWQDFLLLLCSYLHDNSGALSLVTG